MAKVKKKSNKVKMHFIGHRELGVLMINEGKQGLKISRISIEEIENYATANNTLPDLVFGEIARALSFVSKISDANRPVDTSITGEVEAVNKIANSIQSNILSDVPVSNSDFSFSTEVKEKDFSIGRFGLDTSILRGALAEFTSEAIDSLGHATEGKLSGKIQD